MSRPRPRRRQTPTSPTATTTTMPPTPSRAHERCPDSVDDHDSRSSASDGRHGRRRRGGGSGEAASTTPRTQAPPPPRQPPQHSDVACGASNTLQTSRTANVVVVVPDTTMATAAPAPAPAQRQQAQPSQTPGVAATATPPPQQPPSYSTHTRDFLIAASAPASPLTTHVATLPLSSTGSSSSSSHNKRSSNSRRASSSASTAAAATPVKLGSADDRAGNNKHDDDSSNEVHAHATTTTPTTTSGTNPAVYSCFSTNVAGAAIITTNNSSNNNNNSSSEATLATATAPRTSDGRRAYSLHTITVSTSNNSKSNNGSSRNDTNGTTKAYKSHSVMLDHTATAAAMATQRQQATRDTVTSRLRDRAHMLLVEHIVQSEQQHEQQQTQQQQQSPSPLQQQQQWSSSFTSSSFVGRMPTPLPVRHDTAVPALSRVALTTHTGTPPPQQHDETTRQASSMWLSLRASSLCSSATSHTLRGAQEAIAAATAAAAAGTTVDGLSPTMTTATKPPPVPPTPQQLLGLRSSRHRRRAVHTPHKGVTYVVQQVRTTGGRCVFDRAFLALRVDDAVVFRWYDARYHVFEVDKTYHNVVPGGQHSLLHSTSSSRSNNNDNNNDDHDDDSGGDEGDEVSSALAVRVGHGCTFYTHFGTPGDYYFVCTRSTHTMRVHVQVTSRAAYLTARVVPIALLACTLVAVIVLLAVFLSYWLQKKDLFLRRADAESPQQYDAVKRLQSILTLYLFPWVATGVLVLLFTAVLAVAWSLTRRWRRGRSGAGTSYRGVRALYRTATIAAAFVLCVCIVAVLFVCYGLQLNVNEGVTQFTLQLSNSLVNILDTFASASTQGRWLVAQSQQLFPDLALPRQQLDDLLAQINATLTTTTRWTRFGENAAQGASRVLPILLFLVMQIGFLASALTVGAMLLRFRRPLNAVAWLTVACVGVYACMCGAVWALAAVLREFTTGAELLTDDPTALPGNFGVGSTTFIAEVFASCNLSTLNTQPLQVLLQNALGNVRKRLDAQGQTQYDVVFATIEHLVSVAPVTLSEYTTYVMANLDLLYALVNTRAVVANARVNRELVPFIRVSINLVRLLMSLVDCRVFRNAVAQALPTLHDGVWRYHGVLLVCAFVLFGVGVAAAAAVVGAAYCLANPRRRWYEPRTRRWFRFRYCYKVHQRVLLRGRRGLFAVSSAPFAAAEATAAPRDASGASAAAVAVMAPPPVPAAATPDASPLQLTPSPPQPQPQTQPLVLPLYAAMSSAGGNDNEDAVDDGSSERATSVRRHRSPRMFRFLSYKLVLYAASLLMFLDSIVLVLFLSLARSIVAGAMLRALTYMQCAQLLFLLLASLWRTMWCRRVLRGVALLLVLACLVLGTVQATLAYVRFGTCMVRVHYYDILVAGGNPFDAPAYASCSPMYVGMTLETAVYATVTMLNSVTVGVAMLYVELRERRGMIALARKGVRYGGLLAPLARGCGLLRRVFADQLLFKRIYTAVFIVVVVVLLILFALVDITHFRVMSWSWGDTRDDGGGGRGGGGGTGLGPPPVTVVNASVACNGVAAYCALRVNEYVWACAHNAYSSLESGFVAPNHYYSIARQLEAGVRAFMLDVWDDVIDASVNAVTAVYLCHETCLAGRTRLDEVLRLYKRFLDAHPGQVILINFEQYTASRNLADAFARANLTSLVWQTTQAPPSRNVDFVWPTLGELVASGRRVLVFNDAPASSRLSVGTPPWLYYAYDFQYENNYTTTDVHAWQCEIGRGGCSVELEPDNNNSSSGSSSHRDDSSSSGNGTSMTDLTDCRAYDGPWRHGGAQQYTANGGVPPPLRAKLSTVNHMITIGSGSPVEADVANTPAMMLTDAINCSSRWHAVVNIFAFDFWSLQTPLATIDTMNRNLVRYGAAHNFSDKWRLLYTGQDV